MKKIDSQEIQSYFKATSPDSTIKCVECEEPIPLARLKILPKTTTCVNCMEDLELGDRIHKIRDSVPGLRGTIRYKMEFEIEGRGEEVENVKLHIIRPK